MTPQDHLIALLHAVQRAAEPLRLELERLARYNGPGAHTVSLYAGDLAETLKELDDLIDEFESAP